MNVIPMPPRNQPGEADRSPQQALNPPVDPHLAAQWVSAWCEFCHSDHVEGVEGGAYRTLRAAVEKFPPSYVFAVSRITKSFHHFITLLSSALQSHADPTRAEDLAAIECDKFSWKDAAFQADYACDLVKLAGGWAVLPDEDFAREKSASLAARPEQEDQNAEFKALRASILECIPLGMSAQEMERILRRAECIEHAKIMFLLLRDGFEMGLGE